MHPKRGSVVVRVPEKYFVARVVEVGWLTPVMRRIVLGGPGLADFRSTGHADEWFRLVFPAEGASVVGQPQLVNGVGRFADPQPISRWYTVRRWDPNRGQLSVDVVIHGHGTATEWAVHVEPGAEVMISSPAGRYQPKPGVSWQLFIADLTGLPAASRIISALPPGMSARAILEVPNEACTVAIDTRADLKVSWIYNPSPDVIPSALAVASRSLTLPGGRGYVWMAGEAACSRDIRRYFRHELRWPSRSYDIVGYWRPDAEAYLQRYTQIEAEVAEIYEASQRAGRDLEETVDDVFAVMEAHGL
jgi:NADPH-dependent ferric siderophore reductase